MAKRAQRDPLAGTDAGIKKLIELAYRDPALVNKRIQAERCARPGGLIHFTRLMWRYVEPARPFMQNWHIDAICEHLEAVTFGQIKRLLINVPPGFLKSLASSVFWPAWEWGPLGKPSMRYMCGAYSQTLTVRDNVRFRQVIMSDDYQELWGDRVKPSKIQFSLEKVSNTATGWKLATSVGGVGTGERADRVVLDDPNSVKEAESDAVRATTNQWFREVIPTRLNSPTDSAIIVIQQRTHEEDVSGVILSEEMDYEHLLIPMEYDSSRRYVSSIGWTDPRGVDADGNPVDNDGALAWPEAYPAPVVEQLKRDMGPYAVAGQFQQTPTPRGGALFERDWWKPWPPPDTGRKWLDDKGRILYPPFEYVIASVDTAFTEKEENDFSAMTVWGIFRDVGLTQALLRDLPRHSEEDPVGFLRLAPDNRPKVMLMAAWQKRLAIHGPPEERPSGVSDEEWNGPRLREWRQQSWGLVEWVVDTCRRYKVDRLLIETQAQGHGLQQELRRLHSGGDWGVQMIPAKGDKSARAYAVQHLFSNGLVYAPFYPDSGLPPVWCGQVIDQFSSFPKTRFKDLVDSGTHGLAFLRNTGLLARSEEHDRSYEDQLRPPRRDQPLYEV